MADNSNDLIKCPPFLVQLARVFECVNNVDNCGKLSSILGNTKAQHSEHTQDDRHRESRQRVQ